MHTKTQLQSKYDEYYTRNPEKWAGPTGQLRNEFAFGVLNAYLSEPPKYLADVGCGNGHTLEFFSARWPDTHMVGIDLSEKAIALAKRRVPGATFVQGMLGEEQVNAFNGRFDCLILLGVMEHFENLELELRLTMELLRPGGICYSEVPNCIGYPNSEPVEGFRELNTGSHQFEWHLYRSTWERKLESVGFVLEKSLVGPIIQAEFCWILKRAS